MIKPFMPSDAAIILQDRDCIIQANHNLAAGPGFTLLDGKTPIAAGGIRRYGVGIAWFIMTEEAKKVHPIEIIRAAKEEVERMQRENELCEVYAESDNADKWLKHLGFQKTKLDMFVR